MKTYISTLRMIALAMMVFSLVACGGKDSDKTASVPGYPGYYPPGACPNCGGWAASGGSLFMGSAYGSTSFPMAWSIELAGDQNQISQLYYQGMNPPKVYNGPTYLRQAAVNVGSNIMAGNCVIPAGSYSITNSSQGTYSSGTFGIQQFHMSNGIHTFVMSLSGVIVDADANGQPEAFGAQLNVLQGPGYMGQPMIACMDPIGFTLAP